MNQTQEKDDAMRMILLAILAVLLKLLDALLVAVMRRSRD